MRGGTALLILLLTGLQGARGGALDPQTACEQEGAATRHDTGTGGTVAPAPRDFVPAPSAGWMAWVLPAMVGVAPGKRRADETAPPSTLPPVVRWATPTTLQGWNRAVEEALACVLGSASAVHFEGGLGAGETEEIVTSLRAFIYVVPGRFKPSNYFGERR